MISVEAARRHYVGADAAHDFDHVLRVLTIAQRIAAAEGANAEIVHAATLLHDVGRGRALVEGLDHAEVGAEMARAILQGASANKIEAVAAAIRTHRYRSDAHPTTLEARVLFDADKVDAIGAIGVARAFAYCGAHGQRLWVPMAHVDYARWEALGDDPAEHTPAHEFVVKLSRLRDQLTTAEGRKMADERHSFMEAFFRRLDAEVRGEM